MIEGKALRPGPVMGGKGGFGPEGRSGERKWGAASLQSEYKDVTKRLQTYPSFEERL